MVVRNTVRPKEDVEANMRLGIGHQKTLASKQYNEMNFKESVTVFERMAGAPIQEVLHDYLISKTQIDLKTMVKVVPAVPKDLLSQIFDICDADLNVLKIATLCRQI